jgi:predicted PurR-regulated permease PerM
MTGPTESASPEGTGINPLAAAACTVIVIGGIKLASGIVVPILTAAFIALLCLPVTRRLQRWGVKPGLAAVLVIIGVVLLLVFLSGVVVDSVGDLSNSLGAYQQRADELIRAGNAWLAGLGIDVSEVELSDIIDTRALTRFMSATLQGILAAFSNLFLVLLIMAFLLFEAIGLPTKLRRALGGPDADISEYSRVTGQLYEYLHIKTAISLLTGVLAGFFTAVMGLDFPVIWGLVAFLFNFVPNIGSIIAAVPPILLALVTQSLGTAAIVAGGYVAINMVIGNIIEPKLMGRRLGLSPAVVILSLFFWNWVLGPVGMLLSLPLTMVVKFFLEQSNDYRGLAVMLGTTDEPSEEP